MMSRVTDPLDAVAWPVRTERLEIRRARPTDVEATWVFRQLPDVGAWITRAPTTYDSYREQFLDEHRLACTLVYSLADGRMVGDLMLRVEDAWAQAEVADRAAGTVAELGWAQDPAYAGSGLATEAVAALLRVCFTDLGLRRVTAQCFADNEASWRLMERLGMRREGHFVSESLHRSLGWLDGYAYAVLADEWRARATERPHD
jgi:RimJ/RimL family protein N-acetyltransferase